MEDYEEFVRENKAIAKVIWENAFFCGLNKLKKKQLMNCIQSLVADLDNKVNCSDYVLDERKLKDVLFDQKCLLIESLDPDFFSREDVWKIN